MKQNADGYYSKSFFIDLPDGTKKQIKIRGKSPEEVHEKFLRKKIEAEQGVLIINSNTLFKKWVENWLETYKAPKVNSTTLKNCKGILDKYFVSKLGHMKISDIKLMHIQRCINEMEGMSQSRINKAYDYICSCFQKAWENELVHRSPCIGLEKPTAKIKEDRRALTAEERRIFLQAIEQHHRGAFFGIMYACGLRPAEARALTWFNINMSEKTVTITQAVQGGSNNIKEPKTAAGHRTIPIPDWFLPHLQALPKTSLYVFPSRDSNKPMTEHRYTQSWQSFLREMDLIAGAQTYRNQIIIHRIAQDLTPYNLRHTYATMLAEKGVDIKTAQYLLGHGDIRVTMNIYTHVSEKMITDAKEKINLSNA